jgi:hypothetical protein
MVEAALMAPDGVYSDLEILVGFAEALGVEIPEPNAIESAVATALAARASSGLVNASLYRADELAPSLREDEVFSGLGTAAFDAPFATVLTAPLVATAQGAS